MLNSYVMNMNGENIEKISLSEHIFDVNPNKHVLHEVIKNYLANNRQGTQSTLTRAEVRGGGIKPWKQKGTGHARQGSIRSPQWIHGGIALGPKPRNYSYKINKKIKKIALYSILSDKVRFNKLYIIDEINFVNQKTKNCINFLKNINIEKEKCLIITSNKNENVILSSANLSYIKTSIVSNINVYDIMNSKIVIIEKSAINMIEEVYKKI